MNAYQVTQELYEAIMGSNPSSFKGDSKQPATGEEQKWRPVESVSWYDTLVFCNKLSISCGLNPCYSIENKTNPDEWGDVPISSNVTWNEVVCDITANGYRLPTEAEWEFAARGGDPNKEDWKYAYAGKQTEKEPESFTSTSYDEKLKGVGWYNGNSGSKTHEVGKLKPNRLGLYDMSGNVYEWCYDRKNDSVTSNDATYTQDDTVKNPLGASSGSSRVLRGGCWNRYDKNCSVSYRFHDTPFCRYIFIGFRLVRSL